MDADRRRRTPSSSAWQIQFAPRWGSAPGRLRRLLQRYSMRNLRQIRIRRYAPSNHSSLGDDGRRHCRARVASSSAQFRVGRPRLRDEARARADAKRRGGLPRSPSPSATGWPIRQGLAATAGSSAEAAAVRPAPARDITSGNLASEEDAIALPDHERKRSSSAPILLVGAIAADGLAAAAVDEATARMR